MFMTRINHKIDKNHPNNIFFSFFTQFIPNFEQKRLKKGPPSASGHFWEFFRFFCANHLRNTFSSLYQQAGKIGKNVHFIDMPNIRIDNQGPFFGTRSGGRVSLEVKLLLGAPHELLGALKGPLRSPPEVKNG